MSFARGLIAFAGLALATACSPAVEEAAAPEPAAETAHAEGHAHWAYSDQAAWGETCAVGQSQSPIALSSATVDTDLPNLAPTYAAGSGVLLNNGHTLQFTPDVAGSLTIGADAYGLRQFHFHGPSEHTLDGASFPLELHFVHRNAEDALAVVGVMIREGAENPALAALIAAIPTATGDAAATRPTVDQAALLPASRDYFAYAGSLTTPPCTEGVRWNVISQPIEASAAQIAALSTALGVSNRAVQPLNTRTPAQGT